MARSGPSARPAPGRFNTAAGTRTVLRYQYRVPGEGPGPHCSASGTVPAYRSTVPWPGPAGELSAGPGDRPNAVNLKKIHPGRGLSGSRGGP
eukprot:752999-Hanusia_phi.AAC.1